GSVGAAAGCADAAVLIAAMNAPATAAPISTASGARRSDRGWRVRHQLPVASPVVPDALVRVALRLGVRDAPALLEQHLREAFSATGVHLYASGTQALQAAMEIAWNRSGRRGPVALPAYACYDLATAAIGAGLPVTFFDVDPATLS